ncbi:MAG: hypothetical protein HUJ51_04675 [Eggerthellaceae bacterium]|nr:hypothetical protein [Eggerthellaceae bacterium]
MISQLNPIFVNLQSTLNDASSIVAKTKDLVITHKTSLQNIRNDVASLQNFKVVTDLMNNTGVNAKDFVSFLGRPTVVETSELCLLNVYSSFMVSLFMNITFWVGVLMLMMIFRREADSEDIKDFKFFQRYIARYLLLTNLAVLQAVINCIGM